MNTEAGEREKGRVPFVEEEGSDFLNRLHDDPFQFDFFQAVRRLDAMQVQPRTGYSEKPGSERVRYGQVPAAEFAPSTLARFDLETENVPEGFKAKLLVYFMGLCGPNGPMPLGLTEFIYRRNRGIVDPDSPTYDAVNPSVQSRTAPDLTLSDFLDIFHHRAISLFYRAWAEARKTVDRDRPDERLFSRFFGSLVGIGLPSLSERVDVPDEAKLYFTGHLSCQTRHAEGLASILEDYHGVPASIVEFVGHWLRLPESSQCRLGESPETGTVGDSLVIGSSYWDVQLRFRIRLGPMKMADYERFLPGENSTSLRDLLLWILHYVGHEYLVDVQLVLRKEDVPPIALGKSGRLGYTTWLRDMPADVTGEDEEAPILPFHRDADDLILALDLSS